MSVVSTEHIACDDLFYGHTFSFHLGEEQRNSCGHRRDLTEKTVPGKFIQSLHMLVRTKNAVETEPFAGFSKSLFLRSERKPEANNVDVKWV